MISELLLSLALLGGIRDHLDDEGVREAASTSLASVDLHTKSDLDLLFAKNPQVLEGIHQMLDVNQNGEIDVYELAVLGLDGAETLQFRLDEREALVLAEGAVREDGELGTDHVDNTHFRDWFVDTVWNALLQDGDRDGDKELSAEEWAELAQKVDDQLLNLHAPAKKKKAVGSAGLEKQPEKGFGFGDMLDFPLPDNAVEALVVAGSVLTQVAMANSLAIGSDLARRRIVWMVAVGAGAIIVGGIIICGLIIASQIWG